MADSDIVVSALVATATLRGVKLSWAVDDPHASGLLNLSLDQVEVWASTTNNRNTAAKVAEGKIDAQYAGAIEEQTYYFWIRPRNQYQDTSGVRYYGDWYPLSATAGVACTAIGISGLAFGLANGKLVAEHNTPSSNKLTISVKTALGNDPSLSDPVFVAFRNPTLSIGNYTIRQITAPLSIIIASGSVLGVFLNSTPFRIWVVIFDDNGTLKLGVFNASLSSGAIFPLAETTTAAFVGVEDGSAGTADSTGVFYTSTVLTNKTFRVIGFLEYATGLASVGAWASAPTAIRLAGLGTALPGQAVQDWSVIGNPHGGTNTVVIPFDDTIPQVGEGRNIFSVNLTPASACNFFDFDVQANIASSVATEIICALFRDGANDAIAVVWDYAPTADKPVCVRFRFRVQAGDTAQREYQIRAGASQAGTITIGGTAGVGKMGGKLVDYNRITEVAG